MKKDLFSLNQKIIAVTGGYGHLGKSISNGLADLGATVLVLGRDKDGFVSAFGESAHVQFQHCDVSSTNSIQEAYSSISGEYGTIDVLINNAFYGKGDPLGTDEDWAYTVDGTLNATHRCIRELLPFLTGGETKHKRIINVASMYGVVAPDFSIYDGFEKFTNPSQYGASKAGVIQLTKYYASLLGRKGVLVNAVSPGPFPNEEVQKSSGFIDHLAKKTCLGRIGDPEELVGVFAFLSSEASSYITGQNFQVDGGWTIT